MKTHKQAADRVRAILRESSDPHHRNSAGDDRMILLEWRLAGPGPARFGWWSVGAAGDATYLGGSTVDVEYAVWLAAKVTP